LAGEGSHFGGNTNTSTTGTGAGTKSSAEHTTGHSPADHIAVSNSATGHSTAGYPTPRNTNTGNSTTGPHSSNLENKLDPRVDSDRDGSRTVGNAPGTAQSAGYSNMPGVFPGESTSSNPYANQQVDSRLGEVPSTGPNTTQGHGNQGVSTTGTLGSHLGRDAAAVGAAGAVGEGIHHHENDRKLGAANTNPGYGATGTNTRAGPHDSNFKNAADPTVDSNRDGSRTVGNTSNSGHHYGRDAAALGTAGAVGEGIHHHRENERGLGTNPSADYGTTGSNVRSGPHDSNLKNIADPTVDSDRDGSRTIGNTTGASSNGAGHHYGRDAAALGTAGAVGEGIHHHRENERGLGTNPSAGYGTTGSNVRSGPHDSNLKNIADPTVDSDRDGSRTVGNTSNSGHHYDRDAAALGTAGAVGEGVHHHHKNERELGADPSANYGTTGYGTTGSNVRSGPHDSNLKNIADPTVDSDRDGSRTVGNTSNSGHHYGRDAAALGTAGAVGEGIHHHHEQDRSNAGYSGTTPSGVGSSYYAGPAGTAVPGAGPHSSSTANRLDPHVGSNRNQPPIEDATAHHPITGGGAESADLAHGDRSKLTGSEDAANKHHYGRDAGLAAGGAGLAEHEHNKHKHEHEDTGVTTANQGANVTDKHHYGRDAGLAAGGVGIAEHEHNKHKHEDTGTAATHQGTQGIERRDGNNEHGVGSSASGVGATGNHGQHTQPSQTGHPPHKSALLNKLDPRVKTGSTKSHSTADPAASTHKDSKDHHYGRDAAGAGAVGAVGYEAEKHHHHNEPHGTATTGTGTGLSDNDRQYSRGTAGVSEPTYESPISDSTATTGHTGHKDHHYGRDAVGAGAVGAGAYEAEKHHGHHSNPVDTSVNKPLPTAPGNRGVGTGEGTQNALADRTRNTSELTLGDKLHGVERNRGVPDASMTGTHDRNRLHKDPPASHPAAGLTGARAGAGTGLGHSVGNAGEYDSRTGDYDHQGTGNYVLSGNTGSSGYGSSTAGATSTPIYDTHKSSGVPASDTERRDVIGQGEGRLAGNTGVSNSRNEATNY
jgi:hypothetical protein